MEAKKIYIKETPSTIWGTDADKAYLYVHGQGGNQNEAKDFAGIADGHGYQVLSIDLPEHGERPKGAPTFEPWHVVPELTSIMSYCKQRWKEISLFANSIGAWFSMLAFTETDLRECLFVSPVVDMVDLISQMMKWAGVSESRLERERQIPTDFGQTLSWRYFQYAKEHPIKSWNVPTKILYGERDNLTSRPVLEHFANRFRCALTVMKDGEHWFHTKEQMDVLYSWVQESLEKNGKEARTALSG